MSRVSMAVPRPTSAARPDSDEEMLAAETLRGGSTPARRPERDGSSGNGLSWVVQIFGGTMLSIVALACITVFNHFNNSTADLRREINLLMENRAEYLKKSDLESQLVDVRAGLKDLQNANSAVQGLCERSKLLDQQLERQLKMGVDERKDLTARLEEQRKIAVEERKELNQKVEDLRKQLDEERKDHQRRLEEQRKLLEEDRKELTRKLEELRQLAENQHKEAAGKLQTLAERLAAVEGRQHVKTVVKSSAGADE